MNSIWPEGIKCVVVFTFDLDAETFWFSRNPDSFNRPSLLAEGSYGPKVAMPRILKMLQRQNIDSTFFIPGWVIERYPEICKEIVKGNHEIGYHGYLHEMVSFPEQEKELIEKCKKITKDILGVEPTGHRAPEADLKKGTIELLLDMGFEYSTNLMDADRPYLHYSSSGETLVELPTNWLYDDTSHFFFTLQEPERRPISTPSMVMEIWKEEFDGIYEEGGSIVFMLHPQIIGRVSRLKMLEELIEYMKRKPGTFISSGKNVACLAKKGLLKNNER